LANDTETFRYFLTSRSGRPTQWIRLVQWVVLVAWLGFTWWIYWGRGFRLIVATYYPIHGIFTEDLVLRRVILPNWGLVTLALGTLEVWMQGVWMRCLVSIAPGEDGWVWRGRRGPGSVKTLVRTMGGAWCSGGGRWFYVPHGFVNGGGEDWLKCCGGVRAPALSARRLLSPLLALFLLLIALAYGLQAPLRENRRVRGEINWAVRSGDGQRIADLVRLHPEFRPWVRYLSTLPACDQAACLKAQIRDRLEIRSIGPEYGADGATLIRLLVLNGRAAMALKLLGPLHPEAFQIAIRRDNPRLAKEILGKNGAINPLKNGFSNSTLLLEQGRYEEAYQALMGPPTTLQERELALYGTMAYLTGHCGEAEECAFKLMSPDSLDSVRLDGGAPPMGLGSLQRAAREVRMHTSRAVGFSLLDDHRSAADEWMQAEALAQKAGIPGLLDVDRVLLRRVYPGGPWG
jgi:hypothetical protein